MANATARVAKGAVPWNDGREFPKVPLATLSAETTFYTGAMVGMATTGYHAKLDDTAAMLFAGLVRGREGNPVMPIATAGDAGHELDLWCPPYFELAITSVAITDIGKTVYALFDNQGTIDYSATTYANAVGHIVGLLYPSGLTAASNVALVAPAYDLLAGNKRLNATKGLAASGTLTLSKWDLNKVIIINNSGAQTINLPPVASCPAGTYFQFIKKSTAASAATIDGDASEEIDSATTYALMDAEHDCVLAISDGTQWHIAARDIA